MRKLFCLLMLSATALVTACGDSEVTVATPAVTEAVPAEVAPPPTLVGSGGQLC